MNEYRTLFAALEGVLKYEPCRGRDQALIALGLRALLAAIGSVPAYRAHYIAKGGTVLRLRTNEPLDRMTTDLDLSGIELGTSADIDHYPFAAEIGRAATSILRAAYQKGAADIAVRFSPTPPTHADGENPDTATYLVEVSAILTGTKQTIAKSHAYKIDVTCDEYVDKEQIEELKVTSYGIPINVLAYTPLQALAEKMRALLQKHRHYERKKNPGNLVPRHLFDLVPLRQLVREDQLKLLPAMFLRKCAARQLVVDASTRHKLLSPELLAACLQANPSQTAVAWEALNELIEIARLP